MYVCVKQISVYIVIVPLPLPQKILVNKNLKNDTLQDCLVTDICGLVQMKVEQCYCCSVWVPAEMFNCLLLFIIIV